MIPPISAATAGSASVPSPVTKSVTNVPRRAGMSWVFELPFSFWMSPTIAGASVGDFGLTPTAHFAFESLTETSIDPG